MFSKSSTLYLSLSAHTLCKHTKQKLTYNIFILENKDRQGTTYICSHSTSTKWNKTGYYHIYCMHLLCHKYIYMNGLLVQTVLEITEKKKSKGKACRHSVHPSTCTKHLEHYCNRANGCKAKIFLIKTAVMAMTDISFLLRSLCKEGP